MDLLKRIIFWNYERASWQWDVLCVICMIFIFLTPKAWLEKKDRLATRTTRLIVKTDDFSTERSTLETKVRELSGNPNAEIVAWREKKDQKGGTYYEIDVR